MEANDLLLWVLEQNNLFPVFSCIRKGDFRAAFAFGVRIGFTIIYQAVFTAVYHFKIPFHIDCLACMAELFGKVSIFIAWKKICLIAFVYDRELCRGNLVEFVCFRIGLRWIRNILPWDVCERCLWQIQRAKRTLAAASVQSATERSEALSASQWQRSKFGER